MKYTVFGFSTTDLEQVRSVLEQALGIHMTPHDSIFWGDYYLWEGNEEDEIQLVLNEEPLDGGPIESDFPHLGVLLYLNLGSATHASTYPLISSLSDIELISERSG